MRRIESPGTYGRAIEVVGALAELVGRGVQRAAGLAGEVGERRQVDDRRGDRHRRALAERASLRRASPNGSVEVTVSGPIGVDAAPHAA